MNKSGECGVRQTWICILAVPSLLYDLWHIADLLWGSFSSSLKLKEPQNSIMNIQYNNIY